MCAPHQHVPMHLQPPLFQDWTLPGKALPITAVRAKCGGFVVWADVYKGPERGQTNTYCDLNLKRTQTARACSGENAGRRNPNPSPALSTLHPEMLEIIKAGRSALWSEANRALCFAAGLSLDHLCPRARIRNRDVTKNP